MIGRLLLYGVAALGAGTLGAVVLLFLWGISVIELPAVIVRGAGRGHAMAGRVAGVLSVAGAMDVELSMPLHYQEHSLSCEVAALKMALGRYDVAVSESELIRSLPFDSTPKSDDVWGDPYRGFVGDIDGTMLVTGYGVYWDPIARLGLQWKRTEVLRGVLPADVAAHVAAGRPVIVWGNYGRATAQQWRTLDGDLVSAVQGEHARVVAGFRGSVSEPTHFLLLDPLYGRLEWSTQAFLNNLNLLGRHAVVVYPHPRWARAVNDSKVWEISADGTTRHWVKDWQTFEARGGFPAAIVEVDEQYLERYKQGSDITL